MCTWNSAAALLLLAAAAAAAVVDYEKDAAVNLFREYIRINTSQPSEGSVNYSDAVLFWKRQAESLGLNTTIFEYYSGKPIVVITWEGSDPTLPSIMLNSHMDVVAADESEWSHPPFEGYMDADGNIFGRGTQDMKSVSIQYLEAIRRLMADKVSLKRTIHMTMVPDEEIGGHEGMQAFVKSDDFAALNVGFALDEGIANVDSTYTIFYADRTPWQIVITCTGTAGHGSLLLENTAAEKFRKIIDSFLDYRDTQLRLLKADPGREIGTVTSINLTKVSGGLATNIIPNSLSATFDMRLAAGTDETKFNQTIATWISEAGGGDCSHRYIRHEEVSPATPVDHTNPYWLAFKRATDAMGLVVRTRVNPATSDAIRLRSLGVPTLGFFAVGGTRSRIHGADEYLGAARLLGGVDIYVGVLRSVGNV